MGGGEMRVEVLDGESRPVDGFAGPAAAPFGSNRALPVRWAERSLDALRGKTIRLRFVYRDAHLYSFRRQR
jgi:hypothetical protein